MFSATALLYPCVLVALCLGAGLLVDRSSGGFLPAPLLLSVGAAGLIALSQLSTYVHQLAPATPYFMAAIAAGGYWLGRGRARALLARARANPLPPITVALAYLLALAPVLLSGRASFSSYMALADSAVHMIGADYLIHHGQEFVHLDLRNSYGLFLGNYYNSNYPSGADTLFGGSALLLGLPLIWAFQPFNAFLLAAAAGPAWLLARRMGLSGAWAAVATLSAVLPALVYAYELLGSVKEIAALSMILTLGCLTVLHRHWLHGPARRAIPFALVLAAGLSALGPAFGAWGLAAGAALAVVLVRELLARRATVPHTLALIACGAGTLLVAAWPMWHKLSGSLRVAQAIASTGNPGNLRTSLPAIQVFGVWLGGSYKLAPTGAALTITHTLVALTAVAGVLGVTQLLRRRAYALVGWVALLLLVWLVLTESVTTWASAKTLMLTSPVVVLMAWGGVAALKALPVRSLAVSSAAVLALALSGGVVVSDALQYHASDLAPTARYQELATIDSRFAGDGPTLFTDFDEWAMYELRDLDVGGLDFVYPPPALATAARGYGRPVDINRIPPRALAAYPLIVTPRDPAAVRPPAAYRLIWQGSYYQVWRRRRGATPALRHIALAGAPPAQCARIGRIATVAARTAAALVPDGRATAARDAVRKGIELIAAEAPELVRISLAHAKHPRGWGHDHEGLVMNQAGTLSASFELPFSGRWQLWLQGQIMPTVQMGLDGRRVASIGGQLGGNSLVPDTVPPIELRLGAGAHRLTLTRSGFAWGAGDGGSAVIDAIFLTPLQRDPGGALVRAPASRWRTLCGGSYQWIELLGR